MKTKELSFETVKSVAEIKADLQNMVGRAEVGPLQSQHGGLLDTGPEPALGIVIEKSGIGGIGSVQVHVFDLGSHRRVTLVALGDGGMSRAFNGAKNTASLSKSLKMAQRYAEALRQ